MTRDPVRDQADAVLAAARASLEPDSLVAAYLYGSAIVGGLRPDSDLDLFGIVGRRLTRTERQALVSRLMLISSRATRPQAWRPVELTLVVHGEVRPWAYPPRFDFQYGEWLRDDFRGGDLEPWPRVNPDVAVLVTMVLAHGRPLAGPPASDVLAPVPRGDLVRAMTDELPSLLDDLESDTRNVLLTLARIWATLATAEVRPKDAAAEWALPRLPEAHRPPLALARAGYLGAAHDPSYDMFAVRALAHVMTAEIQRASLSAQPLDALPPKDASV